MTQAKMKTTIKGKNTSKYNNTDNLNNLPGHHIIQTTMIKENNDKRQQ